MVIIDKIALTLAVIGALNWGSVGLFGFDCVDVCAVMSPPLPVVHQPEEEIGRTAASYLIQRLEGYGGEPRKTRLPCRLVP